MTDNSAEPSPHTDEPVVALPEDKDKPASHAGRWLLLFAVLLAINFAMAAYFLNQIHSLESVLNSTMGSLRTENEAVITRINSINNRITDIQTQQEGMAAAITSLHEQQPASNEDWALAEIEFLLTLALHQLQLASDINSALVTLETAALRLQQMTDTGLEPVRQQLAADIEQLKSINTVDVGGLTLYLADLIERAEHLPLKKTDISGPDIAGNAEDMSQTETGFSLRGIFVTVWNELKQLVVIKRGTDTRQVLLAPEQEYFLYQNLRLELENARLSVIRNDTNNLHTSIGLLKDWLQAYFDTEDSGVINIIETLDMMAGLDLQQQIPDISSSLETLRAYQRAHVDAGNISTP